MVDQFSRSRLIYGKKGIETLSRTRIAVFGIGGVGGHVAEALVRTGVGALDIIDHDTVDITNINRQIIATHETLGMSKVEVMEKRLLSLNPECSITKYDCLYLPETADQFNISKYDYIVDAVDTVSAKLELITRAKNNDIPIISAMGAGNKTDPTALRIADIFDTSVCPLARIVRKELRKREISNLKVCYSTESPTKFETATIDTTDENKNELSRLNNTENKSSFIQTSRSAARLTAKKARRSTPGSNAFVPAAMGLAIAAEVVRDLTKTEFQ